jgi:copper homeostasis protein
MPGKYLLEISVETAERALAAEHGGAERIELCGDLSVGGVTPSTRLMRTVRQSVRIPIFTMIRQRGGDFVYSVEEFEAMKRSIGDAKQLKMNGVVLGILKKDQSVDVKRTRELVALARPMPVTFHRAFDECANLPTALEDVIQTGAARILTSGGASSAPEGSAVLTELVKLARGRIAIVPGAGIHPGNLLEVARRTKANEFHSGLSSTIPPASGNPAEFREGVRKLANLLASLG